MNSVVIGSGFAGITAALRLRAKNHNVTLIDNHSDLEKRSRVFKKKGFTYDALLTVIIAFIYLISLYFLINNYEFNEVIYKVIFIGLASLTFPHILLEYLLEKNEK